MDWDFFIETIIPVATLICSVFGVFGFFRSLRKPNARLRFTNGKKKITFCPHYYRKQSDKYYIDPPTDCYESSTYIKLYKYYNKLHENDCKFLVKFRLENIGAFQLENYRVEIDVTGGKYELSHSTPNVKIGTDIEAPPMDGVSFGETKPNIYYSPVGVLARINQNDYDEFSIRFIPYPDVDCYELHWRIIAKDCTKKGKLKIKLTPTVEEYDEFHFVNCQRDIPEGAEVVKDLKPYITQLAEKLKKTIGNSDKLS